MSKKTESVAATGTSVELAVAVYEKSAEEAYKAAAKAASEKGALVPISAEPDAVNTQVQRLIDHLKESAAKGEPAELQVDGDHGDAPWQEIFSRLKQRCIALIAGPDAKVLVVAGQSGDTPLATAEKGCSAIDKALRGVIDGTTPNSPRATSLREQLRRDRRTPTSKAGWENDFETLLKAMEDPKPPLPRSVTRLRQEIQDAYEAILAAPSQKGRSIVDVHDWSDAVKKAVLALDAAVDGFASWMHGVTALPKARQDQLKADIFGRRPADTSTKKPVDPPQDPPQDPPKDQKPPPSTPGTEKAPPKA